MVEIALPGWHGEVAIHDQRIDGGTVTLEGGKRAW
jgi:hypothetical protein